MGIIADTKSSVTRIRGYAKRMNGILAQHGIHNMHDLKRVMKEPSFQKDLASFWEEVIKDEGGKVTFTVISATIALSLGGVGIAAAGGAVGIPLLVVLAPAGYLAGQELDSERYTATVIGKLKKLLGKAPGASDARKEPTS